MNTEQQAKQWSQLITKAVQDDTFRKRLLASPEAVVRESGLDLPTGIQLRAVENTDRVLHLVLPPLQRERELSDAELEGVAGGLVVNAIIAVLVGMLVPEVQKTGMTMDQANQVAAGNPMPRPR